MSNYSGGPTPQEAGARLRLIAMMALGISIGVILTLIVQEFF